MNNSVQSSQRQSFQPNNFSSQSSIYEQSFSLVQPSYYSEQHNCTLKHHGEKKDGHTWTMPYCYHRIFKLKQISIQKRSLNKLDISLQDLKQFQKRSKTRKNFIIRLKKIGQYLRDLNHLKHIVKIKEVIQIQSNHDIIFKSQLMDYHFDQYLESHLQAKVVIKLLIHFIKGLQQLQALNLVELDRRHYNFMIKIDNGEIIGKHFDFQFCLQLSSDKQMKEHNISILKCSQFQPTFSYFGARFKQLITRLAKNYDETIKNKNLIKEIHNIQLIKFIKYILKVLKQKEHLDKGMAQISTAISSYDKFNQREDFLNQLLKIFKNIYQHEYSHNDIKQQVNQSQQAQLRPCQKEAQCQQSREMQALLSHHSLIKPKMHQKQLIKSQSILEQLSQHKLQKVFQKKQTKKQSISIPSQVQQSSYLYHPIVSNEMEQDSFRIFFQFIKRTGNRIANANNNVDQLRKLHDYLKEQGLDEKKLHSFLQQAKFKLCGPANRQQIQQDLVKEFQNIKLKLQRKGRIFECIKMKQTQELIQNNWLVEITKEYFDSPFGQHLTIRSIFNQQQQKIFFDCLNRLKQGEPCKPFQKCIEQHIVIYFQQTQNQYNCKKQKQKQKNVKSKQQKQAIKKQTGTKSDEIVQKERYANRDQINSQISAKEIKSSSFISGNIKYITHIDKSTNIINNEQGNQANEYYYDYNRQKYYHQHQEEDEEGEEEEEDEDMYDRGY